MEGSGVSSEHTGRRWTAAHKEDVDMSIAEPHEAAGGWMGDPIGPLHVERTWSAATGRSGYRIAWTAEQLRRFGQAVEQGDAAYLRNVEEAMRRALDGAGMRLLRRRDRCPGGEDGPSPHVTAPRPRGTRRRGKRHGLA
jgi:hypothetical protein